ncbi:MAG: right-handed parallel beta-helix repeat-containing protein, partial [Planctomycetota bacterium]
IVAADDKNPPVITRPDDKQNVLNLGDGGGQATCEYLQLHGLRLTGGSSLIRLYACQQVWIDGCELDHPGAEAITANVQDTSYLHITRNHIHHMESAANTCEGMYLGANNSKARMTFSVIALNHVHDCRGTQGDGIEVKQGSHHNWIVENEIHDCNYPCITVYGTDGLGINLIERNTCYNSGDNVVQVQGEAIVRNNLMINGKAACFASHDHQGKSRALTVVHNTMINEARGAKMSSWNDREGMVFANNAVYCKTGPAIEFNGGSSGVTFVGNVAAGNVIGTTGAGDTGGVFKLAASDDVLKDFADVKFDASARDAHPNKRGSNVIGRADREHVCEFDLAGTERKRRPIAGAFDVK